ncbi:MAG: alpha/beta fold hydrolase [Nitriliruptoraceae bacterium]
MTASPLGDLGARSTRWAGLRSGVVDVRGTAVHLVTNGIDAQDSPATPHLLVHGLGGSATNWFDVMPDLGVDRAVLAMDLPGFGRTVPPRASAARVRANARFLPALLDALGLERVILHGNSMGGLISVLASPLMSERVEAVVLAAPALPSARSDLAHLSPEMLKRFAPMAIPGVGTALLRTMWSRMDVDRLIADATAMNWHDPARIRPDVAALMRENMTFAKQQPWRVESLGYATESLVSSLLAGREVTDAIMGMTHRTLVVWGDGDRLVGRPVIQHLVDLRPDWRVAVLPGVGHVAQMETPDRYVAVVERWLADGRVDAGAGGAAPWSEWVAGAGAGTEPGSAEVASVA